MNISLGISNFLEEIASLSYSVVFLYFFALITEEAFLISLLFRIRPSFPLSQLLPSGSFHKPLTLLHQRADRLKTTTPEN